MRKKIFWILYLGLVVLFIRCNINKGRIEDVKFDLGEGKKAVIKCKIINGDTIFNGEAIYYYANGLKENVVMLKEDKKNGTSVLFDSLGNIYSKSMYVNNKLNGSVLFFKAGTNIVETEQFYTNDVLLCIKLYDDSSRLKQYAGMSGNNLFYTIHYNSDGDIISENGDIFGDYFDSSSSLDRIKVNKEFEIKIPIVNPPKRKVSISITTYDVISKLRDSSTSFKLPVFNYYALYKTKFKTPGNMWLEITAELKDETGKIIKRGKAKSKITIIE